MFSIKNRMYDIPEIFPKGDKKYTCICGESETITHIYNCSILSEKNEANIPYEKIFNGNLDQQIMVFKLVRQNLEERSTIKNEMNLPCDPDVIRCNQ